MVTFTYIISAVVLLGLCIFVHELGHLLGGKMVGIKAKIFSIGYGKGFWKKRIGETTYQVTLIPLGGYCQFYGEEPGESRTGENFEFLSAAPWRRIVTVAMGPLFNLFFGVILFFVMNMHGYPTETNRVYIPEQYRTEKSLSPAWQQGIRTGDRIVKINDSEIYNFSDIQSAVIFSDGKTLKIELERNDKKIDLDVKPVQAGSDGRYSIGIMPYGDRVMVAGLLPGDVAQRSGLEEMDTILSVDGISIKTPAQFTSIVQKRAGKETVLEIMRNEEKKELKIVPRANRIVSINGKPVLDEKTAEMLIKKKNLALNGTQQTDVSSFMKSVSESKGKEITIAAGENQVKGKPSIESKGFIGIYPAITPEMIEIKHGFATSFVRSWVEPYEFVVLNIKGMGMLFAGEMDVRENLSGPIRIAKIAGDVAYYRGLSAFIILMAKISIILMVMNFLPIPVVDGGHLVFFTIEAIRGKPINPEIMQRIQTAGVLLLIMLGVFVIVNDISMLPAIQRLFN